MHSPTRLETLLLLGALLALRRPFVSSAAIGGLDGAPYDLNRTNVSFSITDAILPVGEALDATDQQHNHIVASRPDESISQVVNGSRVPASTDMSSPSPIPNFVVPHRIEKNLGDSILDITNPTTPPIVERDSSLLSDPPHKPSLIFVPEGVGADKPFMRVSNVTQGSDPSSAHPGPKNEASPVAEGPTPVPDLESSTKSGTDVVDGGTDYSDVLQDEDPSMQQGNATANAADASNSVPPATTPPLSTGAKVAIALCIVTGTCAVAFIVWVAFRRFRRRWRQRRAFAAQEKLAALTPRPLRRISTPISTEGIPMRSDIIGLGLEVEKNNQQFHNVSLA